MFYFSRKFYIIKYYENNIKDFLVTILLLFETKIDPL